jgi:hypothetical protein
MTPTGLEAVGLEISEVVASNGSGLRDEEGKFEDWLELRNVSSLAVALDGLELADGLFSGEPRLAFPAGLVLAPGAYAIVFCDEDDAGVPASLHAPFKISAVDGDELCLITRGTNGAQQVLDYVQIPADMGEDIAWARVGVGAPFLDLTPTPGTQNVAPGSLFCSLIETDAGPQIAVGYPTESGVLPRLEIRRTLDEGTWLPASLPAGDGFERLLLRAPGTEEYYRLRLP